MSVSFEKWTWVQKGEARQRHLLSAPVYLTANGRLDGLTVIFPFFIFSAGNLSVSVRLLARTNNHLSFNLQDQTMKKTALFIAASMLVTLASTNCDAQQRSRKDKSKTKQTGQKETGKSKSVAGEEEIAWFSTLESARSEAQRTRLPIMLIAARPECQGVPGQW